MLVVRSTLVGPFAENTYLVGCERTRQAVLIDPGGDSSRVLAMREPEGFQVTLIVCTHGHIDHVAGVAELQELTGAPLQIHADDGEWLASIEDQAAMFGFDGVRPPKVARYHTDGESYPVGEHSFRIIHTPGHSEGSCCLYFAEDRVLFSGDTLFSGSVGRTDLPGGDFGKLDNSIRQKLFPLGDAVRFYPGHGPDATIGDERRSNPFVGEARRSRF